MAGRWPLWRLLMCWCWGLAMSAAMHALDRLTATSSQTWAHGSLIVSNRASTLSSRPFPLVFPLSEYYEHDQENEEEKQPEGELVVHGVSRILRPYWVMLDACSWTIRVVAGSSGTSDLYPGFCDMLGCFYDGSSVLAVNDPVRSIDT